MTETLRMEAVSVHLPRAGAMVPVLEGLDLCIAAGEMLALVGESGSGKTTAALSVPRLLPPGARLSGRITLAGTELTALPERRLRALRGRAIGMVFQDPAAALNPAQRIGTQIAEAITQYTPMGRRAAWDLAVARLEEVGIAEPARRARDYPHALSGGQRQRVTIALALACDPALLIADECTTGLDPVLARQVLDLIGTLRARRSMAVLLLTHDLAQVRRHADAVQVLYAGQSIERGAAATVLTRPLHPYTAMLRDAAPSLTRPLVAAPPGRAPEPEERGPACRFAPRCPAAQPQCTLAPPPWSPPAESQARCLFAGAVPPPRAACPPPARRHASGPLLSLRGVSVRYQPRFRGAARAALHDVSLTLGAGECLAVVGASGSGKTTLGRAVLQMLPYEGAIALAGATLGALAPHALRAARARMAVVFQDPAASLDPTMRVDGLIGEPALLAGHRLGAGETRALLERVGLAAEMAARLPASLSGGQAQRVALARALAASPDLLVLDEPTASLDVGTASGLLALLAALLAGGRTGCLFITHDLAAACCLAQRIAVMQDGRVVEVQDAARLVAAPVHPASRALVAAIDAG